MQKSAPKGELSSQQILTHLVWQFSQQILNPAQSRTRWYSSRSSKGNSKIIKYDFLQTQCQYLNRVTVKTFEMKSQFVNLTSAEINLVGTVITHTNLWTPCLHYRVFNGSPNFHECFRFLCFVSLMQNIVYTVLRAQPMLVSCCITSGFVSSLLLQQEFPEPWIIQHMQQSVFAKSLEILIQAEVSKLTWIWMPERTRRVIEVVFQQ